MVSFWEAVVMVRGRPFFFLDHGTPKGLPGGPEKPAASDYYSSQPGAERESGRASVEPPPLSDRLSSSSPSHKHWFPSTQHATQTHRNLCFVPLLLTVKRFFVLFFFYLRDWLFSATTRTQHSSLRAASSLFYSPVSPSPDLLWLSGLHRWTMPPSFSWGRGLCAAQAPIRRRLGLKSKRSGFGKSPKIIVVWLFTPWFSVLLDFRSVLVFVSVLFLCSFVVRMWGVSSTRDNVARRQVSVRRIVQIPHSLLGLYQSTADSWAGGVAQICVGVEKILFHFQSLPCVCVTRRDKWVPTLICCKAATAVWKRRSPLPGAVSIFISDSYSRRFFWSCFQ